MKRKLSVLLLTLLTANCLAGCNKKTPEVDINDLSYRNASGENGLVAAATQYASNAGLEILKKGGNAFDAAAAVGFALGVTEPNATGLGGSGTFLAYVAKTGEVKQYNFNAMIGKNQTVDLYDPDTHLDQMKFGTMAVAVPGTVMGLTTLVNDFGSGQVTLGDTIDPAIKLAEEGFAITPALAPNLYYEKFIQYDCEQALSIYAHYNENRQKYDRSKRVGEIITNPNQANVLKEIKEKGAAGFYTGWVAEECVKAIQDAHTLTLDDFKYFLEHGAYYSDVLHSSYTASSDQKKYDVYAPNTPNSGGVIMLEALNEIEQYAADQHLNLKQLGYDNPDYIHLIASAMQYAYADRRAYVADTSINPVTNQPFNVAPINGLLNKQYALNRFKKIFEANRVCLLDSSKDYGAAVGFDPWDYDNSGASRSKINLNAPNQDSVGTTSFSVVDKDGNMCCMTFTNSSFWGSYVMPDKCGFMLNNSVTNFNWTAGINQFMPYKHAASYLTPTLVLTDGLPFAAFGGPGSEKVPGIQLQFFLNMVELGMDVDTAIKNARIFSCRVTADDDISMEDPLNDNWKTKKLLHVETYGYSDETLQALRAKGYSIHAYAEPGLAAIQGLRVNYGSNGKKVNYEGAGDARRGGKALAY